MKNENNSQDIKVVDSTKPKSKIIGKCGFRNQKNGNGTYIGSICYDDLIDAISSEEFLVTGTNGKRYLNIIISEHKSKLRDKHGNTHLILIKQLDNFSDNP